MKKIAVSSLVSLLFLSCSVQPTNNLQISKSESADLYIKYNFAEMEREYKSFSTKALSDSYVKRMFNKFLTTGAENPTQVIRQLEFARYLKDVKSDSSYFNSLKNVIASENSIYTKINAMPAVVSYKTVNSATFGVFIASLYFEGLVTTFAGQITPGDEDGTGTSAKFNKPRGIAVDETGNIFVSDSDNNKIRKIDPSANVTTIAGTSAGFATPQGITVDVEGNVYVADTYNHKIRKIDPLGFVTTYAGTISGFNDGTGTSVKFNAPTGVAIDTSGNLYVADYDNDRIRKIEQSGVVTTIAGGTRGANDGTGTSAQFYNPYALALDGSGNIYVADKGNNLIRKIEQSGVVTTIAGGTIGANDGTGTSAQFNVPRGIAVDDSGNIYVGDFGNHKIRKINSSGVVSTLAGDGNNGSVDGIGTSARFWYPMGVALDASGNLYVADQGRHLIRKIE